MRPAGFVVVFKRFGWMRACFLQFGPQLRALDAPFLASRERGSKASLVFGVALRCGLKSGPCRAYPSKRVTSFSAAQVADPFSRFEFVVKVNHRRTVAGQT